MLPRSSRPLAADDYPAIRARVGELRRERARVWADGEPPSPIGPRPYAASSQPTPADKARLLPGILRAMARRRRA
jgi:hypothetical protein